MKLLKDPRDRYRRLMAAGRKVFPSLLRLLAGIGGVWFVVQLVAPDGAFWYTTAVFAGATLATLMVTVFLGRSRDLSDLANMERRLEHKRAVIALVFDAKGRFLMHFQPPYLATSWPEYWVPPGGLVENGMIDDSAQERLNLLVDDEHQWGEAFHIASTNGSAVYRRMNHREEQVPVQVDAYWVQWTEEDAWAPEDAFDGFDYDSLRAGSPDNMPEPVPPYYPELFDYLDAVRRGEDDLMNLHCWTMPKTDRFEAMLKARP